MNKDIIRFYKDSGNKKLVMLNVSSDFAREWCASKKTHKEGKWFDGFVDTGSCQYDCQSLRPMYPQNYTLDDIK